MTIYLSHVTKLAGRVNNPISLCPPSPLSLLPLRPLNLAVHRYITKEAFDGNWRRSAHTEVERPWALSNITCPMRHNNKGSESPVNH
ncbi:hypothetical protein BaRGS_00028059 [Batillaria attramentaria]|uniref:Uncharacterized protein n=1 Tax=Batillaria attramentaria TaxID=370345 RepID=A0ABD0K1D1_9CAEN